MVTAARGPRAIGRAPFTRCGAAIALAALLGLASPAGAQPREPKKAEALFREALADTKGGRDAAACPKFRESQRLDPAPGTLFNLATCEERVGHPAAAVEAFEELLGGLPPNDRRRRDIEARIAALEPKIARLRIELAKDAPPGTLVTRDDAPIPPEKLGADLPVEPGRHVVVASHEDRSRTYELTLGTGGRQSLEVKPIPEATEPAPLPVAPPYPPADLPDPDADDGSGARTAGFVIGGLGLASLGVGAIAGALVLDKDAELTRIGCSDPPSGARTCTDPGAANVASAGRTFSVVSTVGFIAGGVGVGVGAILLLSSASSEPRASRRGTLLLGVTPTPGGAFASASSRF